MMSSALKRAARGAGGFDSALPAGRQFSGGGWSSADSNNLRLLLDAVRRLTEVGAVAVRAILACVTHA